MATKNCFISLFITAALMAVLLLCLYAIESQAMVPAPGNYSANGFFSNPSFGKYMLARGAGGVMGGGMGGRGIGMTAIDGTIGKGSGSG